MNFSIIIQNPLIFMNENYLKKHALIDEFSEYELQTISQNDIIYKIIISFKTEELQTSFITKFNNSFFSENINYNLIIEKFNKNEFETLKESILQQHPPLQKKYFFREYEKEVFDDYEILETKNALLNHNEKEKEKIFRTVKWLVKKLGTNLIQGRSVLNISFPVFLFDKRTMHQVFEYEQSNTPIFLTLAALSKEKFERLKWLIIFGIAQLYITTIQIKPFNPIIGETSQVRIGTMRLYIEHTVNHPITSNFYGIEDNGLFKIYGYTIVDAVTGVNNVLAQRLGKFYVEFNDGQKFLYKIPATLLQGTVMGERLWNYIQNLIIADYTNNLCAHIEFNPDEIGYLKSFFKKKQNTLPDTFRGGVYNLNDIDISDKDCIHKMKKKSTSFIQIEGRWTSHCEFDGDEYWNVDDYKLLGKYDDGFILPSDGRYREDLQYFIKDDEENSQKAKEKLEELQRKDRKLRKEWKKN
jgi:hypothetical protein